MARSPQLKSTRLRARLCTVSPASREVHGYLKPVNIVRVDTSSGRQVISKEVPKLFHYEPGPEGQRSDVEEIPFEEVKEKVKYNGESQIFAKNEKRFFLKEDLEASGKWIEVPREQVVDKQDEEVVQPFDRTTTIEVEADDFVSLDRLTQYKIKDIYELAPDTDKKVRESPERVMQLARHLLDNHTTLVSFFSCGRGYQYYTAVIFPYEKRDGKLWLLMGMSEDVLQLDDSGALENVKSASKEPPLPVATGTKKETQSHHIKVKKVFFFADAQRNRRLR